MMITIMMMMMMIVVMEIMIAVTLLVMIIVGDRWRQRASLQIWSSKQHGHDDTRC